MGVSSDLTRSTSPRNTSAILLHSKRHLGPFLAGTSLCTGIGFDLPDPHPWSQVSGDFRELRPGEGAEDEQLVDAVQELGPSRY